MQRKRKIITTRRTALDGSVYEEKTETIPAAFYRLSSPEEIQAYRDKRYWLEQAHFMRHGELMPPPNNGGSKTVSLDRARRVLASMFHNR